MDDTQKRKVLDDLISRLGLIKESDFLWIINEIGNDICDEQGNTVLHLAASVAFGNACSLLLSSGLNLAARNNLGQTAAAIALESGHIDLALRLRPEIDDKNSSKFDLSKLHSDETVARGSFIPISETQLAGADIDWRMPENLQSIEIIGDNVTEAPLEPLQYRSRVAEPDRDERMRTPKSEPLRIITPERTPKNISTVDDHIASIQLKNFKRFRSFQLNSGAENILTGRNNAGKSSILDALSVTHDVLRFSSRRVPEIAEFEGRSCASFTLPTSALKIPIKNITWNYSENPASIRISLVSGTQFVILLHPDHPIKAYLITEGPIPRTTSAFRRQFPLSLVVVPTLGPVEENEFYLTDKTISTSENTRTAHRHLRNILIRKTEDEFQEFAEEVSLAWPEIRLEPPKVFGHAEPMEMMFLEEEIPREIFWSGFGLQVWMQMVLQFMRGSETSVLVLDEPDIYLHPELQIRMMDLASRRFGQIFVATHSPTIIGFADPDDVFTISAKNGTAIRELQVKPK